MTKATHIKQWVSLESTELLECRTYANGSIRYFMGIGRLWQVERDLAERYIHEKVFITFLEKEQHIKTEWEDVGRRVMLNRAQALGGFKPRKNNA